MASASVSSAATNGHSNGHSNGVATANGSKGEHEEMQYLDLIRRIIDTGGVVEKLK